MSFPSRTLCYRFGNVVYIPNFLCHTGYFTTNFLNNNWQSLTYEEVDWNHSVTFSHIMAPKDQRVHALVDHVCMIQLQTKFLQDPIFRLSLYTVFCLDPHRPTYYDTFGNNIDRIHFIPIPASADQDHKHTDAWLRQQGIDIMTWKRPPVENIRNRANIEFLTNSIHRDVDKFHELHRELYWFNSYNMVRDYHWPLCPSISLFDTLPQSIRQEIANFSLEDIVVSADFSKITVTKKFTILPGGLIDAYFRPDQELYDKAVALVDQK